MPWRTIKNEDDKPVLEFEAEKIVRGFFDRARFLDYLTRGPRRSHHPRLLEQAETLADDWSK